MKIKNLEQELEFINSAEVKKLTDYIVKYPFSAKAEKRFFKIVPVSTAYLYIKKYRVKEAGLAEIFRANNPTLVAAALERAGEGPEVIPAFLNFGEYNAVMKYLKRHDVPEYTEQKLIAEGNENAILAYINANRLSKFAKYDLIMRGNRKIVMLIIAKGGLNEREKMAIINFASIEEVKFLIETQTNPKEIEKLHQIKLIRFSNPRRIREFTSHRRFCKEAEDYFFRHGTFSMVVGYIKHYKLERGQEILLSRNERTEILNYLSKNQLCEESALLLLKRGIHSEIKAYIKRHNFNGEHEVRFIKRGNHREIMLYLSAHSLSDVAQLELMYRRNYEEIMYFITHYPLADLAAAALMKYGSDEAVDFWMHNAAPHPETAAPKKAPHSPHKEILQSCAAWRRL